MKRMVIALITAALLVPLEAVAQQEETYDYWRPQRDMIRRGQQAVFMCNGLFTGNRSIENVFAQELAFLPSPIGSPTGGDYVVNKTRQAVAIGADDGIPVMRAAFREGIGCVILAPDQTFDRSGFQHSERGTQTVGHSTVIVSLEGKSPTLSMGPDDGSVLEAVRRARPEVP